MTRDSLVKMLHTWEPVYFKPELMNLLRFKTSLMAVKDPSTVPTVSPILQQPQQLQPQPTQPWPAPSTQGLPLSTQQQLILQYQHNHLLQQLIFQQAQHQPQSNPLPSFAAPFTSLPARLQPMQTLTAAPAPLDPRLQPALPMFAQQAPLTSAQQAVFVATEPPAFLAAQQAPCVLARALPGPPFPPSVSASHLFLRVWSDVTLGRPQQFGYEGSTTRLPGPPSIDLAGAVASGSTLMTGPVEAECGIIGTAAQVGSSTQAQKQIGIKRPTELRSQTLKVMKDGARREIFSPRLTSPAHSGTLVQTFFSPLCITSTPNTAHNLVLKSVLASHHCTLCRTKQGNP